MYVLVLYISDNSAIFNMRSLARPGTSACFKIKHDFFLHNNLTKYNIVVIYQNLIKSVINVKIKTYEYCEINKIKCLNSQLFGL